MPLVRAQVRIPAFTGLPRDVMTNTLYFQSDAVSFGAACTAINPVLQTFYNGVYGVAGSGAAANHYVWASTEVWYYDMETPTPRVPEIRAMAITPNVVAGTLPAEVALCLSYRASSIPGIPAARRRGRIYLGGLGNFANAGSTSSWPLPSSIQIGRVVTAANGLLTNAAAAGCDWSIYSPTQDAVDPGSGWALVTSGFVGNEWDTQRRRQPRQASRTSFP